MHGICREGNNCRYAHDRSSNPSMVCKFYLKGACTYGSSCRYDHSKPKLPQNIPYKPQIETASDEINHGKICPPLNKVIVSCNNKLVTLKKGKSNDSGVDLESGMTVESPIHKDPVQWVKAAEFVPGQLYCSPVVPASYSAAMKTGLADIDDYPGEATAETRKLICPFAAHGECRYGDNCAYTHGEKCDLCGHALLFPGDFKQQEEHKKECLNELEKDMEISFAVQRSSKKSCGICMEVVMEKEIVRDRRFGILSNCNHCFCLECIRKWRQAKQFENKVIRACPECRVTSDFVTPSEYWVEEPEEKKTIIRGYKSALSKKSCKYFKQGKGECPFNEKCFYLHAYPDGKIASPKPRRRRRRRQQPDGDESITELMQELFLWDFIEDRENSLLLDFALADVLGNIFMSSDSDSDSSDYDLLDLYW
ncbi:putative E3 ubiquitin-protein ligase makorin-1 isoform X1 [Tubulanus polymorphus]